MAPIATAIVFVGICGLLWLDRQDTQVLSRSKWVPFFWMLIACSRPVSSWMSSPASMTRNEAYLEGSPLDRSILLSLIVLALFILVRRAQQTKAFLRANAPILIFLFYCLLSVSWADVPLVSFKRWIRGSADILMILVILTDAHPVALIRWILTHVGYILIPLSILFIRFYPELGRNYTIGGASMWTGVCTDKNALGALCMVVGVSVLWRWMSAYESKKDQERSGQLIALATVFAMLVYLEFVIDSKTALMCFFIGGFVVVFRPFFRKPSVVFMFVTGTVTACYAILIGGVGGGALEAMGRDSSLTGRTDIWAAALSLVTNPILGAGYENFWIGERLNKLTPFGNQAHNGYIEIYLNLGWAGIALLAVVVITGLRNLIASFRRDLDVGRLQVAYFVICLVYNFSEAAYKMFSPVWLMFLWASLAHPAVRAAAVQAVRPGVPRATTRQPSMAVGRVATRSWNRSMTHGAVRGTKKLYR